MMCERVVVVLWAGWIGKSVWRVDQEMIVGDIDGNVRTKFRESDVVCFEVEVEGSDSVGAGGKLYDVLSL